MLMPESYNFSRLWSLKSLRWEVCRCQWTSSQNMKLGLFFSSMI